MALGDLTMAHVLCFIITGVVVLSVIFWFEWYIGLYEIDNGKEEEEEDDTNTDNDDEDDFESYRAAVFFDFSKKFAQTTFLPL
ncbi:hypothetical protein CAEBREN_17967 [Caenorhabditis brenneri]|uniref:Transmembrane protein n=1 Tax=Caenorhabditis brenneri TaxID=135651 RepID=G0NPB1_CAEBE|nr:hypothetical protein CAEBREN_17967 [Caenorhabditis brenneri]